MLQIFTILEVQANQIWRYRRTPALFEKEDMMMLRKMMLRKMMTRMIMLRKMRWMIMMLRKMRRRRMMLRMMMPRKREMMMLMLKRRKMMMLRRMMLRRKTDPKDGKHTLCELAQAKCSSTCRVPG